MPLISLTKSKWWHLLMEAVFSCQRTKLFVCGSLAITVMSGLVLLQDGSN